MATIEHQAGGHRPGEGLIAEGLADLSAGKETEAALRVRIAAPRLRALGIDIAARANQGGISASTGSTSF